MRRAIYTRGTTQITAQTAVPSGSNKPYPLTQAYGRSLLGGSCLSVLRLRRDGSLDSGNAGFHQPPALWRSYCLTVFVSAFFILRILYHVRREKSNVFPAKTAGEKKRKIVQLFPLTLGRVYGLMSHILDRKTLTENLSYPGRSREPAVGVSRRERIGRSGS